MPNRRRNDLDTEIANNHRRRSGLRGLPTVAMLASVGQQVHGYDINKHAVEAINSGKSHIIEPDLDSVLRAVVDTGK